jgi:hypothetical protein
MARARNIKPGFFTNEELVELPFSTRLLFIGLWTVADREGRLEDKPKRIKMHLFPADDIDVDAGLDQLQASGFLTRYEVDGARYIQVLAFRKHQNPHRDEKASTIPAPDGHSASTVQAPESHDGNPADSLIPDSPIADTGNLNPEPASTASASTLPELEPETPSARAGAELQPAIEPTPSAVLSLAMRRAGVNAQPADPRLIALAEQGVTPDTVAAACAEAKATKPHEAVGVGYVVAILNRWSADAAKVKAGGANGARASPRQAMQANAQNLLNRINRKQSHEPDPNIIDIN